MERVEPWPAGSGVVWRSRPHGRLGFVFACRVIVDEPDAVVILQQPGAPISRRAGKRGGPGGRTLLPGGWDGQRATSVWEGPPKVRLHPTGSAYSVIRAWQQATGSFVGWYVNLELPWERTMVGFDSCDDILDVTVSDDLSSYALKDEDELAFAQESGLRSQADVERIWQAADSAIDDVEKRRWPFDEEWWSHLEVDTSQPPPTMPSGWDQT